jgi:hypothetical protein
MIFYLYIALLRVNKVPCNYKTPVHKTVNFYCQCEFYFLTDCNYKTPS